MGTFKVWESAQGVDEERMEREAREHRRIAERERKHQAEARLAAAREATKRIHKEA